MTALSASERAQTFDSEDDVGYMYVYANDSNGDYASELSVAVGAPDKLSYAIEGGRHRDALAGSWYSDGRDAGEVNPISPQGHSFAVLATEGAIVLGPDGSWRWVEGFAEANIRRLFIRKVGEPTAGPAFQRHQRTWYMAGTERFKSQLEACAAALDIDWSAVQRGEGQPILKIVAAKLRPHLSAAGTMWRDLALLHAGAGDMEGALSALQSSIDGKRTPADAWFYLGEARAAQGDGAGARQAWQMCLTKARSKKADYVKQAGERLAT
mgnify:CR=1 FL=1